MSLYRHLKLHVGQDQIAILNLDMVDKSTNVLSTELIEELTHSFQRLHSMKEVEGLMIRSSKKNQFIAGANIDEIYGIDDPNKACEKSRMGQELMELIESLNFPSIAVINGPCLGGGLELALACTYRIAGEGRHVKLASPEVRLGIIPGFGGTQRLPKVVGLVKALDLIVSGRDLHSQQAFKIGLVDDIAASEILENVAREWLKKKPRLRRPIRQSFLFHTMEFLPPLRRWIFSNARKKTWASTLGFYPAPLAAIDVLEKTYKSNNAFSYDLESQKVGGLITSPISKSLIALFLATEEIRRQRLSVSPKPIRKVGVLGAGIMGGGIAYILSSKGKSVRLRDISITSLGKSLKTVRQLSEKEIQRKKIDPREAEARYMRIAPTADWTGFRHVDFVIEAVVEKMEIKKQVFNELAKFVSSDTVCATNTSALSISEIAAATPTPSRVIGLHFFNPVHRMPLVEVIQGKETSPQTIATTLNFAISLGKTPIVVADRPGFLVNRILGLYLNEATLAAEEGIPIQEIERAIKNFGMPMGPFELMDEIGLDISQEVGLYLCHSLPHFPKPSSLIATLRKDGRLGKKTNKGFYVYHQGKKFLDEKYLAKNCRSRKIEFVGELHSQLVDRFTFLMINEAARCLEEKVVSSVRDLDVGMVLGTGFPPFRGGLLAYSNSLGLRQIYDGLNKMTQTHGKHFSPCNHLSQLAQMKVKFE